ncbi:response regulator transcription factor [Fulvivirga lutea]|uniref:Response regulator transcription factor n=1 Tax=Fulvivirga lutea TaxID=2810512 RepID=A0A975A0N8_9BACT|nr:response regulator transcription factor [Fulvivirga lutea]QSE97584.1 response regulator transcription factor [Fulvivirga lutea]
MSKKLKIALVDDHSLIRDGIKSLLMGSEKFDITILEASNGKSALKLISTEKPDIAVLDISLPDINGMQIAEEILTTQEGVKVIMLSMYSDYEYVSHCIEIGVNGYVLKGEGHEILDAIEALSNDTQYYSSGVRDLIVSQYTAKVRKKSPEEEKIVLTNREKEVIKHVVDGLTSNEIADILFISARTVDTHRSNIMKKLKVKNSIALINKIKDLALLD